MPKDYARRNQKYIDRNWGKTKRKGIVPWRASLLLIIIVLLLGDGIFYVTRHKQDFLDKIKSRHLKPVKVEIASSVQPNETSHSAAQKSDKISPPQPIKFDFYQILPNMEVQAPPTEKSAAVPAPTAKEPVASGAADKEEKVQPTPDPEDDTDGDTAQDSVKAPPTTPSQDSSELAALLTDEKDAHYVLQLISLTNADEAKKYQQSLSDKGLQTTLSTTVKDKTTFYRIQLGSFKKHADAQSKQEDLLKLHINSVIVQVK